MTHYQREILGLLDAVQKRLHGWLAEKLPRFHRGQLVPGAVGNCLSELERSRIDSGEWKDLDDLDLQALLKVLRGWHRRFARERLFANDRTFLIGEMINVRNHSSHVSTRPVEERQLATDARWIGDFCAFLDFPDLTKRAAELEQRIWNSISAQDGVVSRSVTAELTSGPARPVRPDFRLADCFEGYELTASQRQAAAEVEEFLYSDDPCLVLKGYAGTGKTFFISGVVRFLRQCHRTALLLAPTGRAANVLASRVNEKAATIHGAIYSLWDVERIRDSKKGLEVFKLRFRLRGNEYDHATVFIVDESSMVADVEQEEGTLRFGSGRLLNDFLEFVGPKSNEPHKKVIFVGDDAQLPPFGMSFSPALDPRYLEKSFSLVTREAILTDIVRQQEKSGILKNASRIRELLATGRFVGFKFDDSSPDTHVTDSPGLVTRLLDRFDPQDMRRAVLVSWKNDDVDSYNQTIRQTLFPGHREICEGDRVVLTRNNFAFGTPLYNGQFGRIVWASGDVEKRTVPINGGIRDGKPRTLHVSLRFRDVELEFKLPSGETATLWATILDNLIDPDDETESYELICGLIKDFEDRHPSLRPKDRMYLQALKSDPYFNALHLRFGYAVTCHRAQGGEWDSVFVDCAGMTGFNNQALRWIYTAFTRAKQDLWVANTGWQDVLQARNVVRAPAAAPPTPATNRAAGKSPGEIVQDLIVQLDPDLTVESVRESQYLVKLSVAREGVHVEIDVSYNAKNRIAKPPRMSSASTAEPWVATLRQSLASLVGDSVSAPAFDRGPVADDRHPEFFTALRERCTAIGISIDSLEHMDAYRTRYRFCRGNARCAHDYTFNKHVTLRRSEYLEGDTTLSNEIMCGG